MASRRVALRAAYDRVRPRVERRSRAALLRWWAVLNAAVLARLIRGGAHPAIEELIHPGELAAGINHTLLPQWKAALFAGIEFERKWIGREEPKEQSLWLPESCRPSPRAVFASPLIRQDIAAPTAKLEMPPAMQKNVGAFLRKKENTVWRQIWTSYTGRLRKTLNDGLRDGDTVPELTKRVQVALRGYSKASAERVARTEATNSMNFGQHQERVAAGIEEKEWLSTIDRRTRGSLSKKGRRSRFNHVRPNGQVQKNDMPFLVSGQRLMYPGDTSLGASAGNVCNCRCASVAFFGDSTGKLISLPEPETPATTEPTPAPVPVKPAEKPTEKPAPKIQVEKRPIVLDSGPDAAREEKKSDRAQVLAREVRQKLQDNHEALEKIRTAVLKAGEEQLAAEKRIEEIRRERANLFGERAITSDGKRLYKIDDKIDALTKENRELEAKLPALRRKAWEHITPPDDRLGFKIQSDAKFEPLVKKIRDVDHFLEKVCSKKLARNPEYVAADGKYLIGIHEEKTVKQGRSLFNAAGKRAHIHPFAEAKTIAHEIAHSFEEYGDVFDLAKGFLHHRTAGDELIALEKFRKKYAGEFGWGDDFGKAIVEAERRAELAVYSGKFYADATEIMSIGVELLYEDAAGFATRSPEWFRFIVGVLSGVLLP